MNWLQNFFTENIGLKLLSLALAVVFWSALGGDVTTEILVTVPVEFRNVPSGLTLAAEPSQVQLRVRGFRRRLRAAAAADFSAVLDFAETTRKTEAGEQIIPLHPENTEAPDSLAVVEITPAQVKLTVETIRKE